MARRVRFEVSGIPCRFYVDEEELASAPSVLELVERSNYMITAGDEIEMSDLDFSLLVFEHCKLEPNLGARFDDAEAEWSGDVYDVVSIDSGVTLNGKPCFLVTGPFREWPVSAPVEAICDVRLWGWLYGAWTTGLLYGGGVAAFPYRAEEGDLELEWSLNVPTLGEALTELGRKVDIDRLVPGCPTCAKHDEEQQWGIDITTFVELSVEHRSQLLGDLWYPCDEHASVELEELGARWTWADRRWSVKTK